MNYKKTSVAVGLLFLIGCEEQIDTSINSAFSDVNMNTPGCAVGVVKNNKLDSESYFGASNLRYKVPIDENTVFNIGSISKHMTASLALLLESEGLISRSDSIKKYYTDGPDWFDKITIYQLIHHQSGFPDFLNDPEARHKLSVKLVESAYLIDGLTMGLPVPNEEITRAVIEQMKSLDGPDFMSGFMIRYNNTGYLILADILEKVSGMEFDQLAEERLFKPLGMSSTKVNGVLDSEIPWRATGYVDWDDGSFRSSESNLITQGDGGVQTTLSDYAKWVNHLMNPKTDTEVWGDLLNSNHPLYGLAPSWNNSGLRRYSNGLIVTRLQNNQVYAHGGYSIDGMKSDFWFSPKLNLGYIQLCNFNTERRVSITEVIEQYGI